MSRVFSLLCNGQVRAGIIGGIEFNFETENGNSVVKNVPAQTKNARRDITVPKGYFVLPNTPKSPPTGSRCPTAAQSAVSKSPSPPQTSNGCGTDTGIGYFVPNLNFVDCCNGHDVCYSMPNISTLLTFPKISKYAQTIRIANTQPAQTNAPKPSTAATAPSSNAMSTNAPHNSPAAVLTPGPASKPPTSTATP